MRLEIRIPGEACGEVPYRAVKPEVEDVKSRRTNVEITQRNGGLLLTIEATDITAARAAVNSFIRLLHVAIGVNKVVRNGV